MAGPEPVDLADQILVKNRVRIVDELNIRPILDDLRQAKIINAEDEERILNGETGKDKVRNLLNKLEQLKYHPQALQEFLKSIKEHQPLLHQFLLNGRQTGIPLQLRLKEKYAQKKALCMKHPWATERSSYLPHDLFTNLKLINHQESAPHRDAFSDYSSFQEFCRNTLQAVHYKDLFKSGTRVLIEGDPGIGKTTLCYKLIHDYSNLDVAEDDRYYVHDLLFAFVIEVRQFSGSVRETLKRSLCLSEQEMDELWGMIQAHPGKCLFLLDGLDERQVPAEIRDLIEGRLLGDCLLLATCRTNQANTFSGFFHSEVVNVGFLPEQAFDYVQKYFTHTQTSGTDIVEKAIQFLETEAEMIGDLLQTPLNCLLLCLWLEEWLKPSNQNQPFLQGKSMSKTGFYEMVVRSIVKRYCEKKNLPLTRGKVPTHLNDDLVKFQRLALFGVLKEKYNFTVDDLNSHQINEDDEVLTLGFLSREYNVSMLEEEDGVSYSFPHRSIQDFFAAKAVECMPEAVKTQLLVYFGQQWKRYEHMCLFLFGMLKDDLQLKWLMCCTLESEEGQRSPSEQDRPHRVLFEDLFQNGTPKKDRAHSPSEEGTQDRPHKKGRLHSPGEEIRQNRPHEEGGQHNPGEEVRQNRAHEEGRQHKPGEEIRQNRPHEEGRRHSPSDKIRQNRTPEEDSQHEEHMHMIHTALEEAKHQIGRLESVTEASQDFESSVSQGQIKDCVDHYRPAYWMWEKSVTGKRSDMLWHCLRCIYEIETDTSLLSEVLNYLVQLSDQKLPSFEVFNESSPEIQTIIVRLWGLKNCSTYFKSQKRFDIQVSRIRDKVWSMFFTLDGLHIQDLELSYSSSPHLLNVLENLGPQMNHLKKLSLSCDSHVPWKQGQNHEMLRKEVHHKKAIKTRVSQMTSLKSILLSGRQLGSCIGILPENVQLEEVTVMALNWPQDEMQELTQEALPCRIKKLTLYHRNVSIDSSIEYVLRAILHLSRRTNEHLKEIHIQGFHLTLQEEELFFKVQLHFKYKHINLRLTDCKLVVGTVKTVDQLRRCLRFNDIGKRLFALCSPNLGEAVFTNADGCMALFKKPAQLDWSVIGGEMVTKLLQAGLKSTAVHPKFEVDSQFENFVLPAIKETKPKKPAELLFSENVSRDKIKLVQDAVRKNGGNISWDHKYRRAFVSFTEDVMKRYGGLSLSPFPALTQ